MRFWRLSHRERGSKKLAGAVQQLVEAGECFEKAGDPQLVTIANGLAQGAFIALDMNVRKQVNDQITKEKPCQEEALQ